MLVKEGLVNQPFIDQWCTGYEELVRYAEKFTPDYVEKETGVKAEDVIAAASHVCRRSVGDDAPRPVHSASA